MRERAFWALRDAGVNLIAVWGYPRGAARAELIFVAENGDALVAAAKQTKLKLSKKQTAIYIHGDDRPGAVADVLAKLATAKINVGAMPGFRAA